MGMLRTVLSIVASFVIAFWLGWTAHAIIGNVYFGTVEVVDGDTIHLARHDFRLAGIDSPGLEISEGEEAARYLDFVMTDRFIWCRHTGDFDDGAYIARCYASFENLNQRMITEGFAQVCAALGDDRYAEFQERAKDMRRGLWGEERMPAPDSVCTPSTAQAETAAEAETIPGDKPFDGTATVNDITALPVGDEEEPEAADEPVPLESDAEESNEMEAPEEAGVTDDPALSDGEAVDEPEEIDTTDTPVGSDVN